LSIHIVAYDDVFRGRWYVRGELRGSKKETYVVLAQNSAGFKIKGNRLPKNGIKYGAIGGFLEIFVRSAKLDLKEVRR
jgi:hypothetical protein